MAKIDQLVNLLNETEGLSLAPVGVRNGEYVININGGEYRYKPAPQSNLSVEELARKVGKMIGYSAGKALAYLKKMSILTYSPKKSQAISF